VVGIVALDLFLAGADFNPAVDPALLDFKPEVVTWLEAQQQEDAFFRINSFDTPDGQGNKVFLANAGMVSHLFDVRGYDSIIPAQYGQFMHLIQENGDLLHNRIGPIYYDGYAALDSALLDLLGVRYILTTEEIPNPNYKLVYDNEIRVYENLDALPRAFMVHEEMPVGEDLGLALRSLNPREKIILDGENNGLGQDLRPKAGETAALIEPAVKITDYTPNEIFLAVATDQPGWLVLADTYFPGWRAYASAANSSFISTESQAPEAEVEVTIHRANGNFRAVYLQPGQWQLRFRYSPRSFQLGLYSSFLSLAVLAFIAGYWAWGMLYRES
jgi:hypothetical protein